MRVLMTTDTVGGVWVYALSLADRLARAGVEVHLVTSGPLPDGRQREQAAGVEGLTLHEVECPLEWMDDPWEGVEGWVGELRTIFDRVRPDVLHANAYAPAAERWGVPVVLVAHSCVATWWRGVYGEPPPPRYRRYTTLVRAALEGADAVVAPTRAFAAAMEAAYGSGQGWGAGGWTRRPEIGVILNGGGEGFAPRVKRRVVMGAGRLWDEGKNVRALVAAAPRIACPVLAAGDGGGEGTVGGVGGVRWLGRVGRSEMRRRLGEAAVFAHPAKYEPFGLGVLEAAASACALVLGDIPTLRELWEGAAVFVEPGDAAGLAGAVNGLLSSPSRRERLAREAWARSRGYSAARMGRAYLDLYGRVLGGAGWARAAPAGAGVAR